MVKLKIKSPLAGYYGFGDSFRANDVEAAGFFGRFTCTLDMFEQKLYGPNLSNELAEDAQTLTRGQRSTLSCIAI